MVVTLEVNTVILLEESMSKSTGGLTVGEAFQLTELPWNRAGQTAQEVSFQVEGTAWVKGLHAESSKVKAGGLRARGRGWEREWRLRERTTEGPPVLLKS